MSKSEMGIQDKKMANALSESATVVIVTYNHEGFIEHCLESVLSEGVAEVVVVDSGSTDDTCTIVEQDFPEVRLVTPEENRGYGAGNNRGVETITTEFTVILNPDTKIESGSLDGLLQPLLDLPRCITTPKVLTYDGSEINTCGNIDHFTGLGFVRGFRESPRNRSEKKYISGLTGACFALRTELFRSLGGFDETFFLYMEDVELSWRAALEDVRILYVPNSVIYHDFEDVSVTPKKLYHVERGRYLILRKYLDRETAVRMLPSLLMTEILTAGYAVLSGLPGLRNKFRGMREGLTTDVKQVEKDTSRIVSNLAVEIPEDQLSVSTLDRFVKKIANAVFRINHRFVL